MRLALNSVCLRAGVAPAGALTDEARRHVQAFRLRAHRLEPISLDEPGMANASDGDHYLFLIRRPSRPPAWQTFVEDAYGMAGFASGSRSTGAIVFCAVVDKAGALRWICWCFGSGSRALRRRATDPRFGLLASLNALTPITFKAGEADAPAPILQQLEFKTTSPYFQYAGHRASRGIPVEGFRFDTTSDLIAAAGGPSQDPLLGDVMGGRTLRFRTMVTEPRDFETLSRTAVAKWQETRYLGPYKWANNMTPVDDENLIDRLRTELLEQLAKPPVPANVDVLLPDDLVALDDERTIHYIGFPRERGATEGRRNLTIGSIANLAVREDERRPGHGLDVPLRFFDSIGELIDAVPLLECLSAQIQVSGDTFVLHDGDFFAVDGDFLARINGDVESIPASAEVFPDYNDGDVEGAYLTMVKNDAAGGFAVLDQALLRVGDETPVEACDLVSRGGSLIHVKRKGKPAPFSHLCLQVANSCSLLSYSDEAQVQLFEKIKQSGASPEVIEDALQSLEALRDGRRGVAVTFALLGRWGNRTVTSLPLLSKISLSQVRRRVAQLGFKPSLALIGSQT